MVLILRVGIKQQYYYQYPPKVEPFNGCIKNLKGAGGKWASTYPHFLLKVVYGISWFCLTPEILNKYRWNS
jgi:hypothetical protein